jgi:hypothetical protein
MCQTPLEQLLDFPQVGGLADEGGAVDRNQGREGIGMIAAEEPKQPRVVRETQQFADQFQGDDFGVAQDGFGTTAAWVVPPGGAELVIDEAEDAQEQVVGVHDGGLGWKWRVVNHLHTGPPTRRPAGSTCTPREQGIAADRPRE